MHSAPQFPSPLTLSLALSLSHPTMTDPAPVPPAKGIHLNLAQPLGQLNGTIKTLGPRQLREELAAQGLDTRGERYVLAARLRQWVRAAKMSPPRATCGPTAETAVYFGNMPS